MEFGYFAFTRWKLLAGYWGPCCVHGTSFQHKLTPFVWEFTYYQNQFYYSIKQNVLSAVSTHHAHLYCPPESSRNTWSLVTWVSVSALGLEKENTKIHKCQRLNRLKTMFQFCSLAQSTSRARSHDMHSTHTTTTTTTKINKQILCTKQKAVNYLLNFQLFKLDIFLISLCSLLQSWLVGAPS